LRDLREDAAQGVCYLPREVLNRFELHPADLLTGRAIALPGYRHLMQYWLDDYLPQLRQRAASFIQATDLPLCWQILREWSVQRYQRIERVFRACDFDYYQFPDRYWSQVKQDLPGLIAQIQQTQMRAIESSPSMQQPLNPITVAQLQYALVDPFRTGLRCHAASTSPFPDEANLMSFFVTSPHSSSRQSASRAIRVARSAQVERSEPPRSCPHGTGIGP
jgi:hypothetical protein